MRPVLDLAVIGGGPAGLAAAVEARKHGLSVALIDEQASVGGQIYRNVEGAPAAVARLLGPDYSRGLALAKAFAASGAEFVGGAAVWDVEDSEDLPDAFEIRLLQGQRTDCRVARQMIVATGAIERPSPLSGWTLPGVMNAGAAQILLKNAGLVPAGPVVLVGAGPLLLLVASQLLDAGTPIAALIETQRRSALGELARLLPPALRCAGDLLKGIRLLLRLRLAGVRCWRSDGPVRITGDEARKRVLFEQDGVPQAIEAPTVLLHHGVIPNTQLTRLLRLEHVWDESQSAWRPRNGPWGESSRAGIRVAGDGAGIAGANAAESTGRLAALGAAAAAGRLREDEVQALAAPLRAEHARRRAIRPLLDLLYAPPGWLLRPADDVIVCRCEEVTAGRIREMAKLGCRGPNQTKFFSRCGMGPCQGRMCGGTVALLLAEANRMPVEAVGYYRIRPPLKPIPLGVLAGGEAVLTTETENNGE